MVEANKVSRTERKRKPVIFQKPRHKYNPPLQLPNLQINTYEIKKSFSLKFLCGLVDEIVI